MGMTVKLTDGRVTVTVEGVTEARRLQDRKAVPLAAEAEGEPERCTPERRTCVPGMANWCDKPVGIYVCSRERNHTGRCIACSPKADAHNLAISDPPTIPPIAELPTGPDMLLVAQLVDDIKSRTAHGSTMRGLCERIQKELSK